jgi:DNA-binding LytR/AlgR family response regulator
VVHLLKRGAVPMIAFITAYDDYAVRAFELNAVDHLLRPVDPEEFIRASRGILVNISAITKATPMPGGVFALSLSNGQELHTSRFHSRLLKGRLLKL